jgi:asparagine synthase (glutamine-hydrolysing)
MCGIAGIVGRYSRKDLEKAQAALRHRGPDDAGIFEDLRHGVGLVHTRLSIIDLSPNGHQPMCDEKKQVVLVFNGEIYNYQALKNKLDKKRKEHWRGNSDTEVVLSLYLEAKSRKSSLTQMLQEMSGIFAFAIWDSTTRQLFLARDALGVKPLYFATQPDRLVFGSEIKAILPLMDTNTKLDPAALQRYLTFLWCPGEGTPDLRIHKLNPGEFLRVENGKIAERCSWYRLPIFRSLNPLKSNLHTLKNETASLLREAVHRQMVSDVPLGAFLSGGLDSSAVVAFAREKNPDIRCFTIDAGKTSPEGFAEDLPFAERVAQHLGVRLEVIKVTPADLAAGIEDMIYQLDEPLADSAPLNLRFICKLARLHGIKVLLSGVGGDDLFSGYRRHRALAALQALRWLPLSLREGLVSMVGCFSQTSAPWRRLSKFLTVSCTEGELALARLFRWVGSKELQALYTDSFRSALAESLPEKPMLDFLAEIRGESSPLDRLLALEQRFFLTDHNLLYTDKMSMAEGVEVRVPFLDLEMVEFAARIPHRLKQRGSQGKYILKKAMEPYLPREVIYRSKSGFGVPLRQWLRVELRDWLEKTLSAERLRDRGLFKPAEVQKLLKANTTGRIDASYTLFSLACIETWCRKFVDGHPGAKEIKDGD